jgi:hypothetical protein
LHPEQPRHGMEVRLMVRAGQITLLHFAATVPICSRPPKY